MNVAIVAIGRNEGDRAKTCLQTAVGFVDDPSRVVYVDSGSTDGSTDFARSLGVTVVDLDLSKPFTAARARNAGLEQVPADAEFVQFLDADCELVDGWLTTAVEALEADDSLAGVAGRRRERHPEATPYNKLCNMEWNTPVGQAAAVGGDAMFRRDALEAVGGYDATMIAGEEPEMCLRMRAKGWTLRRLDAEMTLHDAAMTSWKQWWNRNKRAGHAYAETLDRHPPTGAKEVRSNYLLGLMLPTKALAAAIVSAGMLLYSVNQPRHVQFGLWTGAVFLGLVTLVVVAAYLYLASKIKAYRVGRGDTSDDAGLYAKLVVLGKLPQSLGQLKYRLNKLRGKRSGLIEYKS